MKRFAAALVGSSLVLSATGAVADSASIGVGDGRFARPPHPPDVIVVRDDTPELPKDPYRAPFRLTVGPAAITTGQGIGPGLLAAAAFGSGMVGLRLSAAWSRGETPGDSSAALGDRAGLYAGELTLDMHESGPLHGVFGLGLGALNVGKADREGWAVAGLARLGFEYSLALDGADARFGAGVTGGLLGPGDAMATGAPAFVAANATFSIGF